MNQKSCLKFAVSISALACLLCGCASVGHDFKYQNVTSLELKKTSRSDCENLFGKPGSFQIRQTPEGVAELTAYMYAGPGFGNSRKWRGLSLEFRDGTLNSFNYVDNFNLDSPPRSAALLDALKIGTSKKEDAVRILGNPTGKAICPSCEEVFKDVCGKGDEVWVWFSRSGAKARAFLVWFNKHGVVTAKEGSLK